MLLKLIESMLKFSINFIITLSLLEIAEMLYLTQKNQINKNIKKDLNTLYILINKKQIEIILLL